MDTRVRVRAVVEIDALLLMMSIASQVDHHFAGHFCRNQGTVVSFDESQGHVDSRGNSGAGDDSPILHEKAVRKNLRWRVEFLQFLCALPMGGATTVFKIPAWARAKAPVQTELIFAP